MEEDGGEAKLAEAAGWRENSLFSERERVALDYAEHITITRQDVDDALFARVRNPFRDAEIVELTAAIALETSAASSTRRSGSRRKGFACGRGDLVDARGVWLTLYFRRSDRMR
jgi:hypothetical protein